MTRVLVLYYSSYGHIERMASAVAEGVRDAGASVAIRRVPELVASEVARRSGYKLDQPAPVARVEELPDYDAIIIGSPTRFGGVASQIKHFLDQCGGLWFRNELVGKVGSAFTSTGSQQGGQAPTILSLHVALMHLGMVIVGLPYTFTGQLRMDEIIGCSPYGASTIAGDNNGRQPSGGELEGARYQGRHVATVAMALARAGVISPALSA